MSYTSLLIHKCLIEYFTEALPDPYGVPVKTWHTRYDDKECRLVASTGTELKVGAEIVVADYKLFLEDITITEQDKVTIDSKVYEILLVQDYADGLANHHKQCWLRISR
ncbi:hypothetical protein ES703_49492 [subsurface metagenome]